MVYNGTETALLNRVRLHQTQKVLMIKTHQIIQTAIRIKALSNRVRLVTPANQRLIAVIKTQQAQVHPQATQLQIICQRLGQSILSSV